MTFWSKRVLYRTLLIIAAGININALASVDASAQEIFNSGTLHEIRIQIAQVGWFDTLATWYDAAAAGAGKQFLPVDITIDGNKLSKQSGIRFKGQYSYTGFPGNKKPFRIHFNKFSDKQDYEGIKKINLHNLAGDPSFLREFTSYDMLRYVGLSVSRVSFTRLYINDIYWGCYLIAEEPEDKLFLKQNFGTDEGNLFDNADDTRLEWRGADPALYPEMKLQTKDKTGAWDNLLSWINLFNNCFDTNFNYQLSAKFDIDNYMKALAMDVYLNNWDSYADNGRNFFIYDDPQSGKLRWVPWDYNLAMWKKPLSIFPKDGDSKYNYKPLVWRINTNDSLKAKYLQTFCKLLDNEISNYPLEAKTRAAFDLIKQAVEEDNNKFYSNEAFYNNRTDGVVVNMMRSNIATDVWLPGITSLLAERKDTIRKELIAKGCNCTTIVTDPDLPAISIKTYPNPVSNELNIYTDECLGNNETLEVTLSDGVGRQVAHASLSTASGTAKINTAHLGSGMYILRSSLKGKTTFTKIIKL